MLDVRNISGGVLAKTGCPRELYPDASSKDAPVPPDLPIPNCDCGFPAHIFQSKHPNTAARCFYTYSRFNVRNYLHYRSTKRKSTSHEPTQQGSKKILVAYLHK